MTEPATKTGKAAARLLALAMLAISCGCSPFAADKEVVRLRDGARISFAQMLLELRDIDFVVVGEAHDRMESHRAELRIIKGLEERDRALAVGLEMLRAGSQAEIERWRRGDMSQQDFIRIYYRDWGMPWPLYRDIFLYLKEKDISIVGLNVSREISRRVAAAGVESLGEEELRELPPGLSCDVTESYKEYIRRVFRAHAPENERSFRNFCEAQVLWDQVMAWSLIRFAEKNPGTKVVVLCGITHALRRGLPSRVAELSKTMSLRIVVPQAPTIPLASITPELADYILLER